MLSFRKVAEIRFIFSLSIRFLDGIPDLEGYPPTTDPKFPTDAEIEEFIALYAQILPSHFFAKLPQRFQSKYDESLVNPPICPPKPAWYTGSRFNYLSWLNQKKEEYQAKYWVQIDWWATPTSTLFPRVKGHSLSTSYYPKPQPAPQWWEDRSKATQCLPVFDGHSTPPAFLQEWPVLSEKFPGQVQYADKNGKLYAAKINRYYKRHFPEMPDHEIALFTARFNAKAIHVTKDMQEMIRAVSEGPWSCMQKFEEYRHPYKAYDPEDGWALAYREEGDKIVARALLYKKTFVRTYGSTGEGSKDPSLEFWLINNGYELLSAWPTGAQLTHQEGRMPYLDGEVKTVDTDWCIRPNGPYKLNNTDGSVDGYDDDANLVECDRCGQDVEAEYTSWALLESGTQQWCHACCRARATSALDERNNSIYVPDRDIVTYTEDGHLYKYSRHFLPEGLVITVNDSDTAYRKDRLIEYDNGWYQPDECIKTEDGSFVPKDETTRVHGHLGLYHKYDVYKSNLDFSCADGLYPSVPYAVESDVTHGLVHNDRGLITTHLAVKSLCWQSTTHVWYLKTQTPVYIDGNPYSEDEAHTLGLVPDSLVRCRKTEEMFA
jgi:hypothetical protein